MQSAERLELLTRATSGDQDAFTRLLESVTVRLACFIRRSGGRALGADCDADDLFQTTVDRAWRVLPEFQDSGPDSFYRWIVALARSVILNRLDYLGAKGREGVRHIDSIVEGGAARAAFDSASSVSSLVARREEIRRLERALATLDAESRRLIERSVLEGATISEIAAETGLPRSSAWDRLGRAMQELRRLTTPEG